MTESKTKDISNREVKSSAFTVYFSDPEFYVFYNCDEPCPPEEILKLSSTYLEKTSTPTLELSVKVININLPEGHALLEQCRPLYEYSWFIQKIKDYIAARLERDDAITLAIKDCEREGIMTEFVREHGSEAVNWKKTLKSFLKSAL